MNAQQSTKSNDKLDTQQVSIVTISALTAQGDLENLKIQLNIGLDAGLTVNEIKEILVQLYAYCGFPRSLNAINTFKTVLDERKAKGLEDKLGKTIISDNNETNKYDQGRKVLETLSLTAQPKPAPGFGEFAPRIDQFLKEHLFADIFASDVLSYQQRELVTISALVSMSGVEPQLKSHINMGMNTGISKFILQDLISVLESVIGKYEANTGRKVLNEILLTHAD